MQHSPLKIISKTLHAHFACKHTLKKQLCQSYPISGKLKRWLSNGDKKEIITALLNNYKQEFVSRTFLIHHGTVFSVISDTVQCSELGFVLCSQFPRTDQPLQQGLGVVVWEGWLLISVQGHKGSWYCWFSFFNQRKQTNATSVPWESCKNCFSNKASFFKVAA